MIVSKLTLERSIADNLTSFLIYSNIFQIVLFMKLSFMCVSIQGVPMLIIGLGFVCNNFPLYQSFSFCMCSFSNGAAAADALDLPYSWPSAAADQWSMMLSEWYEELMSMASRKTVVTPVCQHWSYHSLAWSHQYKILSTMQSHCIT